MRRFGWRLLAMTVHERMSAILVRWARWHTKRAERLNAPYSTKGTTLFDADATDRPVNPEQRARNYDGQ